MHALIPMGTLAILALFTLGGDYYLKVASTTQKGLYSFYFAGGFVIYALGAFGWYFAMKNYDLATIGVIYSCMTIIGLALLGLWFGEGLTTRQAIGVTLAILALIVAGE